MEYRLSKWHPSNSPAEKGNGEGEEVEGEEGAEMKAEKEQEDVVKEDEAEEKEIE